MVEINAEMPSIRQRIKVHEIPLGLLELFAFERQLLLREGPEFPLGRFPVAGRHRGLCE